MTRREIIEQVTAFLAGLPESASVRARLESGVHHREVYGGFMEAAPNGTHTLTITVNGGAAEHRTSVLADLADVK
jgi:hypothetical protein